MSLIKACAGILSPAGARARLSVLIFHRVLPRVDPLFPGEIDAHRFDAILRWVSRWFNVVPLGEAVERLSHGDLPTRALAITFDDGYADNHDVALPILRRQQMSATFFVASDFLDGGRMWNDTVIEAIRKLDAHALDLEPLGLERVPTGSIKERRTAIDTLLKRLKHQTPIERERLANEVARRCGGDLPDNLMMTSGQVRNLQAAGMSIGGHTRTHPILGTLDSPAARAEIVAGKERLEQIVGEAVDLFAYPNGKPNKDFIAEHVEMVRAAGFKAAVTTAPGVAREGCDLFQIPRFTPWDRSRIRFGIRLVQNLLRERCETAV